MNFIKEVFSGKKDDAVHRQFIRFGKGEYKKRALLRLWKTKNVKIKGSLEFENDFVLFVAGLGNVSFSGNIWSKEQIPGLQGAKKEGKIVYNVSNLTSSKIKEIAPLVYYFLLNADSAGIKLKINASNSPKSIESRIGLKRRKEKTISTSKIIAVIILSK